MALPSFCADVVSQPSPDILRLKSLFRTIMIVICVIGVAGNILNLVALRTLRTVPFMYIRALAIFDLAGLTAIIVHFLLQMADWDSVLALYYEVWIQDVLINSLLVAGLYSAVLLTVERYLLIRKPHKKRLFSIQQSVTAKIVAVFLIAVLLHCPIALQNTTKRNAAGHLVKGNNKELLCREPWYTIFNYYKMFREMIRFGCVILLIALNSIIAKSLQIAKRKRRLLCKRGSQTALDRESNETGTRKKEANNILKSFTEKKLTALMIAICLIYVIGNLPQMIVMAFQNETAETLFGFQVFRNIANTLEVLNHCLNFFIFCMASSEYSRAFLTNCRCFTRLLLRIPGCASYVHSRRLNSNPSTFEQREFTPNEMSRRKSSQMSRKSTACSSTTQPRPFHYSNTTLSLHIPSTDSKASELPNECVVLRNDGALDSGDEYL